MIPIHLGWLLSLLPLISIALIPVAVVVTLVNIPISVRVNIIVLAGPCIGRLLTHTRLLTILSTRLIAGGYRRVLSTLHIPGGYVIPSVIDVVRTIYINVYIAIDIGGATSTIHTTPVGRIIRRPVIRRTPIAAPTIHTK